MRRSGSHGWIHGLPLKMRFKRSKIYLSVIPVVAVGLVIGFIGAIMGIGGGFILVPLMIYLLRVPTSTVIGTSMVLTLVTMIFATMLHAVNQSSGRRRAGADPDGRRRHRRAIRRACRAKNPRRASASPARPARAVGRHPLRLRAGHQARRALHHPGNREEPDDARALLAIPLLLAPRRGAPARAERLIVSVSNHRVTVTPNYSGEELVLFGSVEKDANTPANRAYDLVVTVAGPRADMVTRRKERKFGIWINTDSRQFLQVPPIWRSSPTGRSRPSLRPRCSGGSRSASTTWC